MMKNENLELWRNDHPVCPYCGHVEYDAWEIDFGHEDNASIDFPCPSCDKEYLLERSIIVSYTTAPIDVSD